MALGLRVALNQKTPNRSSTTFNMSSSRLEYEDGAVRHRRWDSNGTLVEECWRLNGEYHRIGGPSFSQWDSSGRPKSESWCLNGIQHRIDGPSTRHWCNGILTSECWDLNGKQHRIGGPASRHWSNGSLEGECWFVDGKYHRIGGAAARHWHSENDGGTLKSASWFVDGIYRRIGGEPWHCSWDIEGTVKEIGRTPKAKVLTAEEVHTAMVRKSFHDKILRSSRLLILSQEVPKLSGDILSVVGGFLV